MAELFQLKIEGIPELVTDLHTLGLEVEDLKAAWAAVAAEGAVKAAGFAPKVTGRLAGDIRGNRAKSKAVVIAGRSSVPYAGPINYGWKKRNIQPAYFMQKASDAMEPVALQRLETEINLQIRRRGLA